MADANLWDSGVAADVRRLKWKRNYHEGVSFRTLLPIILKNATETTK